MTYLLLKGIAAFVLTGILVVAGFFAFLVIASVEFAKIIVEVVRDLRSSST